MTESVWDYPRPPRLEPNTRRIEVIHHGVTIAATSGGWRVLETSHPPVFYIPIADVRRDLLKPSQRSSFCEFKGAASYWNLHLPDGTVVPDVGWFYPDPTDAFAEIKDAVAFYASRIDTATVDGEVVTPQAGRFYGGWITAEIVGPFKS
ncbi:uncharacterized protein (DUF427 family) [Allocatelliglobosispora scoriae]|uniref:Uncharacterized protein (DUF427 family) n=1 Tax=Allocatelliglobosispora scoriae TaxID=643052 RepID=A0A841BLE2_9ACTN|nr:DUF427 domain-containing protein [Allocatelliglobosispora scoriae]MBB5867681.1 uncharacterized protein (DUF427 family) [Allocatelliglobosispora scoriae]